MNPSLAELNAHYRKTSSEIEATNAEIKAAQEIVKANRIAADREETGTLMQAEIERGETVSAKERQRQKDAEKARRAEVKEGQKVPEAEAEKAVAAAGGPLTDSPNVGWTPGA